MEQVHNEEERLSAGLLLFFSYNHAMIPAMVILQTVYLDSRKAQLMVNIRMQVLKIHVTAVTIPLASLNGA